ncbi:MAG: hypothetical protein ABI970_09710 [Chloroflexota bacterium]
MNKARFMLISVMILLSFAGRVVTAQERKTARDFLFIGIDPKTLNAGRNGDIYLVRSDGSRVVNLTNSRLDSENHAFWSADGTKIYFSRNSMALYSGSTDEQSSTSFYVMDISDMGEKTGERLLFNLSDVMGQPMRVEDWVLSPDEKNIVFIPNNESLVGTMFVNIDGTNVYEALPVGVASTIFPLQWSPDSTEFAYQKNDCNVSPTNLCPYSVTSVEGDKGSQLICTHTNLMKRWHPREIFLSYDFPNFNIQQGDRVILHDQQYTPFLSPDGSTLAYSSHDTVSPITRLETLKLGANNSPHTLTSEIDGTISFINWSPDSKQIAFVAHSVGYEVNVYVINVDGTGQKMLLSREVWDADTLKWRPDPPPKVGV